MPQVLAMFCCLVLIATTFISHTVGAMVILPIVRAVGTDMAVSGCCYCLQLQNPLPVRFQQAQQPAGEGPALFC